MDALAKLITGCQQQWPVTGRCLKHENKKENNNLSTIIETKDP
jgi:hypothetical protein